MSNFRPIDRDTGFLMPPSVDEWLPERHLARFVVEVVEGLDLRAMTGSYRGSGEASYHPRLLLGLMIYGYATGVFSSRKLERATYDSVAFRFIAANEHPDHDTIATFRRRFLKQIEALFVQVLGVAREMGVLKLGTVALDGTKIHANASRHSALSYEHARQDRGATEGRSGRSAGARPRRPIRRTCRTGCRSPRNWRGARSGWPRLPAPRRRSRRGPRSAMRASRPSMRPSWRRARPRRRRRARSPAGGLPQPPVEGPLPTDQVNLTDEESRIMPVAGGGFEQCYNAQAVVAADSLLVVAADVVQAPNDKQQLEPMLDKIADLPDALGKVGELLADNGYFSEANVNACAAAGIEPVIAMGREAHHPCAGRAFCRAAAAAARSPRRCRRWRHRLQTPEGKKRYALRKQTPEPVFGIIKSVLGFRQFLLRGLDKRPRRVEPRDHGVEHEADVRPGGCDLSQIVGIVRRLKTLTGHHRSIEATMGAADTNSPALRRAS